MTTSYGSTKDKKLEKLNSSVTSVHSDDLESKTSSQNPFADPNVAEYYRNLYEKCEYECRSVFDPEFEWEPEEEKKLLKKLDIRVALSACIMFVGLQIDRGNLQQAVSDNLLNDLGMTTDDYNTGNTIFLVCFLIAELPSQLISKALGPDIFIPLQMLAWSIVALCQGALSGRVSFFITRALIGALEGGFIADLVLWLSYFYKSNELPIRLSWFWTTLSLVQIGTSLLAFGLLRMRGVAGMAGWRWLFIIEGVITLLIAISAFYLMVPSATQTKNKLHPKGWFSDKEIKIVVNRVLRDDPSKGDMHNRQGLTPRLIFKSLSDYDLWPVYLIGLFAYIPTQTVSTYQTLNLKQMGLSTFNVNLLTIPGNVIHIIWLLIITWSSERIKQISLICLMQPLWSIPLLAILAWWKDSLHNVWGTWTVITLVIGCPYIHAICVSWVSRNANSIRSRSVCSALYNMTVQIGSIIGSNIYRADDAPYYRRGNTNLFIFSVIMIPIFIFAKFYYVGRNRHKERKWNSMTPEEQSEYINTTTDEGNKRLDFRFVH
ncbi:Piso0_003877 [Millerozyma farinosa CBS 7064]|uniref:Piso0_003877 protein n=1 Tax=Pichia sorbitophila (strain ATCC MYA-4447 / BCRC 22081 / CBS 7064 / NBRC 10061 / NRRL Y-12695) TaxID=559304 RepID=G8Y9R9_PICSO|nr:Piso0_003877 [Millerozyma farinosa CBS 7064]CCE84333.1 Piso0_003877 [Millerozyma farinosa CBS 7064]